MTYFEISSSFINLGGQIAASSPQEPFLQTNRKSPSGNEHTLLSCVAAPSPGAFPPPHGIDAYSVEPFNTGPQWMTLAQAVDRIKTVRRKSTEAALTEIIGFIASRSVPTILEDANGNFEYFDGLAHGWLEATICLDHGGTVLVEETSPIRNFGNPRAAFGFALIEPPARHQWRRVHVAKRMVEIFWPLPSRKAALAGPALRRLVEVVAEELYSQGSRPNIARAETEIRTRVPEATREVIRKVLGAAKFASRRRGQGRPSK